MARYKKNHLQIKLTDDQRCVHESKGPMDPDVLFAIWMAVCWGATPDPDTPEGRAMERFVGAMKAYRGRL